MNWAIRIGSIGVVILSAVLAVGSARSTSRARAPRRTIVTTSADVWLGNLDGQIAALDRLVAQRPDLEANVQRLSASHHLRGRYRGDLDEIQLGIDLAAKCGETATCLLMKAEQEQSLHRFAASRDDLDRAVRLGADRARAADLRAELDWNEGRYEPAIDTIRRARRERPSPSTWLREAQLEHDLGHEDLAEIAFAKAEALVVDTTPLPVAHLDVQRGIRASQIGRREEAIAFFRAAVARMPAYVAAQEHLAEALHGAGKDDEAIRIYEDVVRHSDDPEFAHALGELYRAHGKEQDGLALEKLAAKRYELLLARYPEAMAWHASEFFLARGDVPRAVALLEENVKLRPNGASHAALARALLAAGRVAEAKAAIDRALATPLRSARTTWTASRIAGKLGDREGERAHAKAARAIDPTIGDESP